MNGPEYIKRKREELFRSRREAARIAKISDVHLLAIEKRLPQGLNPSPHVLRKICDGWGIKNEYAYVLLLFGYLKSEDFVFNSNLDVKNSSEEMNELNVYGYDENTPFKDILTSTALETVQSPRKEKNLFALKIHDNSMFSHLKKGQVVILSKKTKLKNSDYTIIVDKATGKGLFMEYKEISKDIAVLESLSPTGNHKDIVVDKTFHKKYDIVAIALDIVTKLRD